MKYYRDNILARCVLNDERLKIGSQHGGKFWHDHAQGYFAKATRGLLKDHDIAVVPWPPAYLSPIEKCFCEIQRRSNLEKSQRMMNCGVYVSDMVVEDDFTQFIKRCYDNVMDRRYTKVKADQPNID